MNKKIATISLMLILSVTLAACTNNQNNNNPPPPPPTSNTTYDIIWWNLFDEESVVKPLIEKYESQNQNVNIQYVQKTAGANDGTLIEKYRQELDENLKDNEPLDTPDIITLDHLWLGKYQSKLSPSTTYTKDQITNEFYPAVAQDFVRGNSVYGVPMSMDSLALIVNQKLMSEISAADSADPENNWFDFLNQAQRVTRLKDGKVDVAGFAGGLNNVEYLPEIVSMMMLQSSITMTTMDTATGYPSEVSFANTTDAQVVLENFRKYFTQKTWDQTFTSEVAAFLSQKLVMFIAPSWRLNDVLRLNEKYNLGLDITVKPVPQINPGDENEYVYWPTYWGLSVTSDSQLRGQAAESWKFIKFLTEEAQLRTYNESARSQPNREIGIIYPRKSMGSELKSDKYLGQYVTALEKAKTWDMVDGFQTRQYFLEMYSQNGQINSSTLQTNINSGVISKRTTLL